MHVKKSKGSNYADRVVAIKSWLRELGRQVAQVDLCVEIDAESLALVRTSHTVKIAGGGGVEAVVLTKEEFLNEYDLFERSAVPKLRAAVERLGIS